MANELNDSRLVTLLRIALRDTERIWDLTIADKAHMDHQRDDDLEEHLNELEVLEEGTYPLEPFLFVRSSRFCLPHSFDRWMNRAAGERC